MRIAQIMLARGFGGAERFFVDLCLALAARGHQVLAVGDTRGVALKHLSGQSNIECIGIRCYGNWDFMARRALRRELERFAPAVVQAHLARAAHLGGQAAHALTLPSLAKTHNLVDVKYYRHIDCLVPTTAAQAEHLRVQSVSAERQRQIPNFSALTPVASIDRRATQPWLIKSAGRLVPKKGYTALISAFARLRSEGWDARLVIGGGGPEAARLRAQSAQLGVDDTVSFPGWIDNVAEFLKDAHVFALPSHDEPFGIVVLEAMACGVPIVTTPTAGPLEILDESSACFATRDDAEALFIALKSTLADYVSACLRADVALTRFREHYTTDVVVTRYLGLYNELIAQHAGRGQS
jgi:glycosyltransferase involved in cell wall biosynthesis